MEASDIDADGHLDLIVAISDSAIGILAGNGDGTFQPALELDSGAQPLDILVADLNLDTQPDLAISASGGVTVLINVSAAAGAPGDANVDGFVDALDLVDTANAIINGQPAPGGADCNGDSVLNVGSGLYR